MKLALVLAAGLVLATACDRWEGVTVRNDTAMTRTVRVSSQRSRKSEIQVQSVEVPPDVRRDVGSIGGPPDPPPDVIVRAFDPSGALVYCHRFTPRDYENIYGRSTVSLTVGDLRCG